LEVFGSAQQVKGVLQGLLDASRKDMLALDHAIQSEDGESQRDILHRIYGALRLLGDDASESLGDSAMQRLDLVRRLDALEALLGELQRADPGEVA
jgi:HPt (histidine-containing phosphotransfer) domain-containing protein